MFKSFIGMQEEILKRANWDGGWPRVVFLFPWFITLARNEEELLMWEKENKKNIYLTVIFSIILQIMFIAFVVYVS